MGPALSIALKDVRLLVRDRMGFFFTFFFPLLIAVFFGMVFQQGGGPAGIPVAIVDLDATPESGAFAQKLRGGGELELNDSLSYAEAEAAVRSGKLRAMIVLQKGFGDARKRPFWGEPVKIELGVDPSRAALASMLNGVLSKHAYEGMSDMFADPSAMRTQVRDSMEEMRKDNQLPRAMRPAFELFFNSLDSMLGEIEQQEGEESAAATGPGSGSEGASPRRGWQPVEISTRSITGQKRDVPANSFALTFPQGIIWGLMGCALSFAITLVTERTRGTLIRLRIAPLSRAPLLGGKALGCFVVTFSVAALLMVVARVVFDVRPTSLAMLTVAIVCSSLCFVGIMMLLAAVSKTEAAGNGLGWGVLLLLSMIGGGMVPLEFLPGFIKSLSVVSPIRWALLALEGGVFRDATVAELAVPCGVLLGIGAVCFGLGTRLFKVHS
jgi:ABC-2 type transport system permease protein